MFFLLLRELELVQQPAAQVLVALVQLDLQLPALLVLVDVERSICSGSTSTFSVSIVSRAWRAARYASDITTTYLGYVWTKRWWATKIQAYGSAKERLLSATQRPGRR